MVTYSSPTGDSNLSSLGGGYIPNNLMFPKLSQNIIETALPAQVARQLFINFPTNGNQAVVIPLEKGSSTAVASRVGEGDDIPLDIAPIVSSTITCYKVARGTAITNEMVMFQQVPIIEQRIKRQGLVMGNTVESDCIAVIEAASTDTTNDGSTSACTGKSLGLDMTMGTITGIGQYDVIQAKARIQAKNMFADTLLVNPAGLASISMLPHYHAECLYGKSAFGSGELGNIEGLRVLCSTLVPASCAYVINSNKTATALGQYVPMGYFIESLPITSVVREEPRRDGIEIYSRTMYAPAVVSAKNIERLTY